MQIRVYKRGGYAQVKRAGGGPGPAGRRPVTQHINHLVTDTRSIVQPERRLTLSEVKCAS